MTQSEATRLESFEALLDNFRTLPNRVERPRTFMEIAGYSHHENACSNILAFFMDPVEAHGLGSLVLDSLAIATGIAGGDEGIGSNASVEREVGTDSGNRIDILINSDEHAILIENKIFAAANNPFDDYAAYLDKIAGGRNKRKILLTLYQINAGSKWGFTNLTHEEFVGQIRSLLGRYVSNADARHLTMFLDFLNTLENLQKGTRMDQQFVNLLAERSEEIETFSADLQRFRNELKGKVKSLQNLVDASYPDVREHVGSRGMLSYTSVHVINVADFLFHINTSITPHGWDIDFAPTSENERNYSRLNEFLQRQEIPFRERERYGFIYPDRFAYDEDLDNIRLVVQELVDKLATSQERKA